MRRVYYFLLLLLSVGVLAGCKTKKAPAATFSDLNGDWSVVEINGQHLDPEQTHQVVTLNVTDRTLSGNAGCNRMMGKIEYNEHQPTIIKFPNIATTRMACPGDPMKRERELLDALNKVVRFAAVGEYRPIRRIALYGTDNTLLVMLERQ